MKLLSMIPALLVGLAVAAPTNDDVSSDSIGPTDDNIQLGINCRGSSMCGSMSKYMAEISAKGGMLQLIQSIPDTQEYAGGAQIARKWANWGAHTAVCVYAQKTINKVTGRQVKDAVQAISDNGCRYCGSVPLHPGNNVDSGELTINYVYNGCASKSARDKIC